MPFDPFSNCIIFFTSGLVYVFFYSVICFQQTQILLDMNYVFSRCNAEFWLVQCDQGTITFSTPLSQLHNCHFLLLVPEQLNVACNDNNCLKIVCHVWLVSNNLLTVGYNQVLGCYCIITCEDFKPIIAPKWSFYKQHRNTSWHFCPIMFLLFYISHAVLTLTLGWELVHGLNFVKLSK